MSVDHPVLDQVVLGASSLFDAKRAPIAAHMTVFPQRPDAPIDAETPNFSPLSDSRATPTTRPGGKRPNGRGLEETWGT